MSEYWISRDKYYCKYCKIYIADDKPSRIQHETGFRHKGNYERYIRDIYKRGARDAKDKVEEAREIARIDAAAKAAMGIEPDSEEAPVASTSKTPAAPPPPKPSDPYANYTTAESLGYKDDAAEQKKEEADLRKKEGTIGQWQKVAKRPPPLPQVAQTVIPTGGLLPAGALPSTGVKQEENVVKAEEEEVKPKPPSRTDDGEQPQRKGYFTEKSYDPDDDDFDPTKIVGGGQIKLKRKRLTLKEEQEIEAIQREREEALARAERERAGSESRGGWAVGEIKEEPLLEFEEQKAEVEREDDGNVDVKPTAAASAGGGGGTSGFKKRKMHGAGTVRKK
ncbi:hypothetical protein JCM11491_005883 [Sporobolomyces phaffii]